MPVATDSELSSSDEVIDIDDFAADSAEDDAADVPAGDVPAGSSRRRVPDPWRATVLGFVVVAVLAGLVGWAGVHGRQAGQLRAERSQFLEVAKQGALDVTNVDWENAEANVRRVLDESTGDFGDGFAKRSQAFIAAVQQNRVKTVGAITRAGLESETPRAAEALVVVTVETTRGNTPEPEAREWRMRISVQKVGGRIKVSNVGFVS